MKCLNKAEQWVERGFHGRMVELPCGMTGIHGEVVLCNSCQKDQEKKYPQGWRHHPGDTCKHGVWLNPEHDCNCGQCESS